MDLLSLVSPVQPASATPNEGPVQVPSFVGHPHTHMLLVGDLALLLKNWVPSSWVRSLLDNLQLTSRQSSQSSE